MRPESISRTAARPKATLGRGKADGKTGLESVKDDEEYIFAPNRHQGSRLEAAELFGWLVGLWY